MTLQYCKSGVINPLEDHSCSMVDSPSLLNTWYKLSQRTVLPCSADHEQDWQPYPVDLYSCYICDHTHIHIHTYIDRVVRRGRVRGNKDHHHHTKVIFEQNRESTRDRYSTESRRRRAVGGLQQGIRGG